LAILIYELAKRRAVVSDQILDVPVTLLVTISIGIVVIVILTAAFFPRAESKGLTPLTNWSMIFIMYGAMLGGIVAQFFFFSDDTFSFRWRPLLKPILASPIVFIPLASAYQGAAQGTDFTVPDLIVILVAFQNGFFWKMVFDKQSTPRSEEH
jgi:hypothetical protein